MNPYQQSVTDIAKREAVRQDDIARLGRNAAAESAGAWGGSRAAILEGEAGRNLQQNLGDIQRIGDQQGWQSALAALNADRQAALGAGDQAIRLGGAQQTAGLTDAAALQSIGASQEAKTQSNLDVMRGDFLEQRDWQRNLLSWYSNLLKGQQSLGSTNVTTQPPPSAASQLGGLGLLALSAYGMMKAKGGMIRGPKYKEKGYAQGGLISLADIKKMVHKHEKGMHMGEPLTKLAQGGLVPKYQQGGMIPGLAIDQMLQGMSPQARRNLEMQHRQAGESSKADYIKAYNERNMPAPKPDGAVYTGLMDLVQRIRQPIAPEQDPWAPPNLPSADSDLEGVRAGPGMGAASTAEPAGGPVTRTRQLPGLSPNDVAGPVSQGNLPVPPAMVDREGLAGGPGAPMGEVPPEAEGPDWLQRNSIPIAAVGARMAAARSGENFLQSAGEGILGGLKMSNELRRADREDTLKEREISRKEREDAGTLSLKNRLAQIDERVADGKLSLGEAQQEYYRAQADYLRNNKGTDAALKREQAQSLIDERLERAKDRKNTQAGNLYRSITGPAEKLMADPIMAEDPNVQKQAQDAFRRGREAVIKAHPESDMARAFVIEDGEMAKRRIMASSLPDDEKQNRIKEVDARLAKYLK